MNIMNFLKELTTRSGIQEENKIKKILYSYSLNINSNNIEDEFEKANRKLSGIYEILNNTDKKVIDNNYFLKMYDYMLNNSIEDALRLFDIHNMSNVDSYTVDLENNFLPERTNENLDEKSTKLYNSVVSDLEDSYARILKMQVWNSISISKSDSSISKIDVKKNNDNTISVYAEFDKNKGRIEKVKKMYK